jgi:hypothetical protein
VVLLEIVMFGLIRYYFRPRYVVMKGLQIDNRAFMFIGARATFLKDEYGNSIMSFSNNEHQYYTDRIYKRIWTFKQLMKWRRLLGKEMKVVEHRNFRWQELKT